MDQKKQSTISFLIKAAIGVVFAVFVVILLAQYITMAQLNAKNSKLETELESATTELKSVQEEHKKISENYEDYVEDYTRDKYDYGYDGDVLINKE